MLPQTPFTKKSSWPLLIPFDDLSIVQTLYDANNLDDELEESERKWEVYFAVNSQLNEGFASY